MRPVVSSRTGCGAEERAEQGCVPDVMRWRWTAGGNLSGCEKCCQSPSRNTQTVHIQNSHTVHNCERTDRIWSAGVQEV